MTNFNPFTNVADAQLVRGDSEAYVPAFPRRRNQGGACE